MKTPALILAGFAASVIAPAYAGDDTDFPHRDWGKVAVLDMSQTEASACLARQLARMYGAVMPIVVDGGSDIDAGPGGAFGTPNDPWLRYKVRVEGGQTLIRVFYRHPVAAKWIDRDLGKFQKKCLKVRSIGPNTANPTS
ncbi:hypothetical protein LH128_05188 [Sphingomonas sp. LH128]|uniref:hypothetical protein n=1 Tax=Sphingomonas sp. LH128 TaxID=473781 RepID=UPI00027C9B19|nr:hypothetical protein [Sphingomonas sp. LH128]EJU14126.1 hypothetical protein LH128_05188 [Sphingomonas sp. LH128]